MRAKYYAIRRGDRVAGDPTSGPTREWDKVRMSGKHFSPTDACKAVHGVVTSDMWVKDLGGSASPYGPAHVREVEFDADIGVWTRISGDELWGDKLEWFGGKLVRRPVRSC